MLYILHTLAFLFVSAFILGFLSKSIRAMFTDLKSIPDSFTNKDKTPPPTNPPSNPSTDPQPNPTPAT